MKGGRREKELEGRKGKKVSEEWRLRGKKEKEKEKKES